jgi:hypothetical protein
VIGGNAECLSFQDPRVRSCTPIDFKDRSACTPPGAEFFSEVVTVYDVSVGDYVEKYYGVIKRGNSLIKFHPRDDSPVEFRIAQEDESDFAALSEMFSAGEQP